jgi:hypothetical protein
MSYENSLPKNDGGRGIYLITADDGIDIAVFSG